MGHGACAKQGRAGQSQCDQRKAGNDYDNERCPDGQAATSQTAPRVSG